MDAREQFKLIDLRHTPPVTHPQWIEQSLTKLQAPLIIHQATENRCQVETESVLLI